MRDKMEAVEIVCPRCKHTEIRYLPEETIPKCPECNLQMVIKELLDEGIISQQEYAEKREGILGSL